MRTDSRWKRKWRVQIRFILIGVCILFSVVCIVTISSVFITLQKQLGITPHTFFAILTGKDIGMKSSRGKTNVLLLGIPGGDYAGSDLTDTMMLASLDHDLHTLTLFGIPRDVWSDTLKDKVNSAYHYGEEKKIGGGLVLSKVVVEDVIGIPIHYAVVISFQGFQQIIDILGGIDVVIPTAFVDTEYPIAGKENDTCNGDSTYQCRYETLTFAAGVEHMDGARALAYVRSRHAKGEEGTDFARSRRQQEVIRAIQKKMTTVSVWTSPARVIALIETAKHAIVGDMTMGEALSFVRNYQIGAGSVRHVDIAHQFVSPPDYMYGGRYVLVPIDSFEMLHAYIQSLLLY